MISLPLSLYPRSTGLVRWAEILLDAVFELTPFPHNYDTGSGLAELGRSGAATTNEEKPQGMVKVHKLPVLEGSGTSRFFQLLIAACDFISSTLHPASNSIYLRQDDGRSCITDST